MRHPRAAIVAADEEMPMAEVLHHLHHVTRHGLLGVGCVVGRGFGFERTAVAAQIRTDHREALRQGGRHRMPHGVRLRIAVQQQQWRPRTAATEADLAVGQSDMFEGESFKEHCSTPL